MSNWRIYDYLDLSDKRKVFACGDIHGCFDELEECLELIGFNKELDVLISLGDLVDRGPKSHLAIEYAKQPWFKRVIGNHESLAFDNSRGDWQTHTFNGGGWMNRMFEPEAKIHGDALIDGPLLLEIKTPKGLKVGFVHADLVDYTSWRANINAPYSPTFLWSRKGFEKLKYNPTWEPNVAGLDKMFFGHNAVYDPIKRGNCNWIDTGSGFVDGKITVVDVETF